MEMEESSGERQKPSPEEVGQVRLEADRILRDYSGLRRFMTTSEYFSLRNAAKESGRGMMAQYYQPARRAVDKVSARAAAWNNERYSVEALPGEATAFIHFVLTANPRPIELTEEQFIEFIKRAIEPESFALRQEPKRQFELKVRGSDWRWIDPDNAYTDIKKVLQAFMAGPSGEAARLALKSVQEQEIQECKQAQQARREVVDEIRALWEQGYVPYAKWVEEHRHDLYLKAKASNVFGHWVVALEAAGVPEEFWLLNTKQKIGRALRSKEHVDGQIRALDVKGEDFGLASILANHARIFLLSLDHYANWPEAVKSNTGKEIHLPALQNITPQTIEEVASRHGIPSAQVPSSTAPVAPSDASSIFSFERPALSLFYGPHIGGASFESMRPVLDQFFAKFAGTGEKFIFLVEGGDPAYPENWDSWLMEDYVLSNPLLRMATEAMVKLIFDEENKNEQLMREGKLTWDDLARNYAASDRPDQVFTAKLFGYLAAKVREGFEIQVAYEQADTNAFLYFGRAVATARAAIQSLLNGQINDLESKLQLSAKAMAQSNQIRAQALYGQDLPQIWNKTRHMVLTVRGYGHLDEGNLVGAEWPVVTKHAQDFKESDIRPFERLLLCDIRGQSVPDEELHRLARLASWLWLFDTMQPDFVPQIQWDRAVGEMADAISVVDFQQLMNQFRKTKPVDMAAASHIMLDFLYERMGSPKVQGSFEVIHSLVTGRRTDTTEDKGHLSWEQVEKNVSGDVRMALTSLPETARPELLKLINDAPTKVLVRELGDFANRHGQFWNRPIRESLVAAFEKLKRLLREDKGQDLAEYTLLLAGAVIAGVVLFANRFRGAGFEMSPWLDSLLHGHIGPMVSEFWSYAVIGGFVTVLICIGVAVGVNFLRRYKNEPRELYYLMEYVAAPIALINFFYRERASIPSMSFVRLTIDFVSAIVMMTLGAVATACLISALVTWLLDSFSDRPRPMIRAGWTGTWADLMGYAQLSSLIIFLIACATLLVGSAVGLPVDTAKAAEVFLVLIAGGVLLNLPLAFFVIGTKIAGEEIAYIQGLTRASRWNKVYNALQKRWHPNAQVFYQGDGDLSPFELRIVAGVTKFANVVNAKSAEHLGSAIAELEELTQEALANDQGFLPYALFLKSVLPELNQWLQSEPNLYDLYASRIKSLVSPSRSDHDSSGTGIHLGKAEKVRSGRQVEPRQEIRAA